MWKGAISSLLRFNQKFPTRHAAFQLTLKRRLNVSQTAEALRPFIFAVHPDFFGQHPEERATNEHSLKQLYAYIDGLRGEHHQVRPIDLKFFLRNYGQQKEQQSTTPGFRPVSISLPFRDIYSTVTHILESCDIPTDHIQQSARQVQYGQVKSTKEATWDAFFYDYVEKAGGPRRQPSNTFSKDDTDVPLCLWMKLNMEPAREKMVSTQPIRDEADSIKKELMEKLRLEEISWKCPWDINLFKGCLKTLRDLVEEYPDVFQNVKGGKMVFGHSTRLSYEGKAVLGHRDVPRYWLGLVNGLNEMYQMYGSMAGLEQQISACLGGVQVCRTHLDKAQAAPFKAYYQVLGQMLKGLYEEQQEEDSLVIPAGSLKDIQVQIISDSRPPVLSPSGKIYISHTAPPKAVKQFLIDSRDDARRILELNRDFKAEVAQLTQQCKQERSFSEFSQKDTVTNEEMRSCCQRLLEDPAIQSMDLRGAKIRVGRHYNLLDSGEMCIPWNWK
ncbi:T-cell activation inhibitor, mitochondrial-like isoform X2 [Amphiura filiformis]|uniref:T-cell activation inhibitor, mitochondrial-like isoform X2 n=1 Tax=Amphiura filiformis TaxID=82378 RepID=UPI003B219FE3